MECREVREYLPAYNELARDLRSFIRRHLDGCPDCRAELERYREVQAGLGGLAAIAIEPPSWLLPAVTETVVERAQRRQVAREAVRRTTDPKVIVGGAIVVAGLVGAGIASRRRRRRGLATRVRQALAEA